MVPKRSQTPSFGTTSAAARRRRKTPRDPTSLREAGASARAPEGDSPSSLAATTAEGTKLCQRSIADVAGIVAHERVELMQIQAMLKCLYEVLLYSDDDDSIMHADVANVCARLIDESVRKLDVLPMQSGECNGTNELSQRDSEE